MISLPAPGLEPIGRGRDAGNFPGNGSGIARLRTRPCAAARSLRATGRRNPRATGDHRSRSNTGLRHPRSRRRTAGRATLPARRTRPPHRHRTAQRLAPDPRRARRPESGAAYLPVDPALPAERRRYLIEQTAALELDPSWLDAALDGPVPILPAAKDTDRLAYVIYTLRLHRPAQGRDGGASGGGHHGRHAESTARRCLGAGDRAAGLSSLSFDLSVWDIFGPLSVGGALVLAAARCSARSGDLEFPAQRPSHHGLEQGAGPMALRDRTWPAAGPCAAADPAERRLGPVAAGSPSPHSGSRRATCGAGWCHRGRDLVQRA